MLELDDAARAAGVTAVIGMGASPGTSNLLAVKAMNACDTVERIFTAWRAGAGVPRPTPEDPEPETTAAVQHWIHNCSAPIKVWRDGGFADAWGLEQLTLSYPGIGEDPVWTCGHPEPLTLPRVRPELQEALNVMTSRQGLIDAVARIAERVKSGELDVPTASKKLLVEPNMWGSAAGPAPVLPDLFAIADGVKDGERVRVGARPLALPGNDMGEYTGIPLAVATLMLVRGEVDSPGVHGPEGAVDPDIYFRELATYVEGGAPEGDVVEVVSEPLGTSPTRVTLA
jgi:saccharopine dehydrogenase-like NADP-dependent oxidoreductase